MRSSHLHASLICFICFGYGRAGAADLASRPDTAKPMIGFAAAHAAAEAAWEEKFDRLIDASDQRRWLEQMAAEPNQVGTAHDKANAEFMLQQFRAWGWDAHIETFEVLYPTPIHVALAMVAPNKFTARLHEPPVPGDTTSARGGVLPPYNVYGADGDITAELVYANHGMPDDYKELARYGIDVRGKIVIARYGAGWRGLKPKLAYEHGAIGCIIYSDPRDDGYGAGDAYPRGGFRPADGVQRGSVDDMMLYPGDPLTPNVGSTDSAQRLPVADAKSILKIPVLPISYADAQPLLAALDGPVAPESWRGALPITYHLGPGPAKVYLVVQSEWSNKPIYDVIAMLNGSEQPDEWVIRGNHHDGWVCGAWDPLAANVALMSEAKALGTLVKQGWRPKRTLVYASWDGEEPALLGSTEWVETHAEELKRKAVLYVNSDTNGRGFLRASGSHSFQTLVNEVATAVMDPQTKVTVSARLRAKLLVDGNAKGAKDEAKEIGKIVADHPGFPIGALGSGSDYSAFLQHIGIASLDIRYGGEDDQDGVYHSLYDSYDHYERFGDPGLAYGVALAQTIGRVMLRTADADILPVQGGDFSSTIERYVRQVHELENKEREETDVQHRLLDEHAYELAADPTKHYGPPKRDDEVPFLDLSPLDNAVLRLKRAAKQYDQTRAAALKSDRILEPANAAKVNELLQGLEQELLAVEGLPGRPWYQHMIYAPGMFTGYGVKTLPGVREGIEERHWADANRYAGVIAKALDSYSDRLDQAAAGLAAGVPAAENGLPSAAVKHVAANGSDFAYVEAGTGEQVVFVHGALGDYRDWTPQVAALASRFHVIAYSRRYHFPNQQIAEAEAYTLGLHAADLVAFLQALHLPPVNLVGHSYGGSVAAIAAAAHPELIRTLTLVEPSLFSLLSRDNDGRALLTRQNQAYVQIIARLDHGEAGGVLPDFIDLVAGPGAYEHAPAAAHGEMMENLSTLKPMLLGKNRGAPFTLADAAKLTMPVLLISNERSPRIFHLTEEQLQPALVNVRRVTLNGVSHFSAREDPAAFNAALLEFLGNANP